MTFRYICLAATLLTACDSPDGRSGDEIALSQHGLWAYHDIEYWPGGNVSVCFQPRTHPWGAKPDERDMPCYSQQTTRIRTVIESAFESIPGTQIDFTGWDDCPGPPLGDNAPPVPGVVSIMIKCNGDDDDEIEEGGWQVESVGYPGPNDGYYLATEQGSDWGTAAWDAVVEHEAAHVLGFSHEWDRDDFDTTCVGPRPDPMTPGDGEHGPEEGVRFTRYDHRSVLNETYCGDGTPGLSAMDQIGLAIVYPDGSPIPIRATNGFNLGSLIVANGIGELTTTWTWGGASEQVYDEVPHWLTQADEVGTGISIPVSSLDSGLTEVLGGWFTDWLEREHQLQWVQVLNDRSYHTALVAVIL
jgi:hypothetical protein